MTKAEDVAAAWDLVDTATNALAARVQTLIDEINKTATEGLNGPQTEAVLARLAGLKGTLEGLGANPSNPVPPPPPPAPPMPGPFGPNP